MKGCCAAVVARPVNRICRSVGSANAPRRQEGSKARRSLTRAHLTKSRSARRTVWRARSFPTASRSRSHRCCPLSGQLDDGFVIRSWAAVVSRKYNGCFGSGSLSKRMGPCQFMAGAWRRHNICAAWNTPSLQTVLLPRPARPRMLAVLVQGTSMNVITTSILALFLAAGAAHAQSTPNSQNNASPGSPAGSSTSGSGGNTSTGSGAAPSGK